MQRYFSTLRNPSLPIPSLMNLSTKYLKSLTPLMTVEEHREKVKQVEVFMSGFGAVLQDRLLVYGKEKENWLESIWLQKAYLEWREPSMINVNYWAEFYDHINQPKELLIKPPPKGTLTSWQLQRATGLIHNLLTVNSLLDQQSFPVEMMKGTPLCMTQFQKVFGTTRMPGDTCDTLHHQYPSTATHIVVLTRGRIFKVQVLGPNKERVSLAEINRQLLEVGRLSLLNANTSAVDIGVLTAGHRDNWFQAYSHLCKTESNKSNLEIIKDALFAVCLDDSGVRKNKDESHLKIFHNHDASNRWFDKSIQLIVSSSGRAGLNGEHSPTDATVPGAVMAYALKHEPAVDSVDVDFNLRLANPVQLEWVVDETIQNHIKQAQKVSKALIDDTESVLLHTDVYGSRYMKQVAATSPDAYIQMALQLTYYRISQQVTPVYESASTRLFAHGRTETVRSCSTESTAFVKAFDDDDILYDQKRDLFQKAIASHNAYMKDALMGKGIDRHMLGLRCMIKKGEEEMATLFNDPWYLKSMYFRLSTSNMSPGTYFYGGFGPVVPDGYGVNYAIDKYDLKFSISTKRSCPSTSSYRFRETLEQSLIDMMVLFPKRSQVWGVGWQGKLKEEREEEKVVEKMKFLSDEQMRKQKLLADRYGGQSEQ